MSLQPGIRYVTSRDGTRLAMAVWGSGPPIVGVALHLGDHIDAPSVVARHWGDALSRHQSFVRFDARGCGLSDRRASEISLVSCLEDLEAVVDVLGHDRVTLLGWSHGAALAVEFAASHPERVGSLVVYGGYARGRLKRVADAAHVKEAQAVLEAVRVAFGEDVSLTASFRRFVSSRVFPSATEQQLEEVDAAGVGRFSADVAAAYTAMMYETDVSESARRLTCPVLMFHARRDVVVPFDEGCHLASLIPRTRFVPLDDGDHLPLDTNPHWPQVLGELREFLGWPEDAATFAAASPRQLKLPDGLQHRLMAILAADAAGFSRLMAIDERATLAALDAARQVFKQQIDAHHGRMVDTAGDSVLAVFETASGAVDAALAIQRQLAASSTVEDETRRMQFRIGVHLGDVMVKGDGTVYGNGVNIASRLQALALPGGILVSDGVHSTIGARCGFSFEDHGLHSVKNIPEPVRTYRLSVERMVP